MPMLSAISAILLLADCNLFIATCSLSASLLNVFRADTIPTFELFRFLVVNSLKLAAAAG